MRATAFRFMLGAAMLAPGALWAAQPSPTNYVARADVRRFIDEMVDESDYDRATLVGAFRAARYQRSIIAAMQRPLLEPPTWSVYSRPFLSHDRIDRGAAFWAANESELDRARVAYGVPPEIIVAIIGVETDYGRNVGRHRAFDALVTLTFDYPRRATFFRAELKDFLLLARDLGVSPLTPTGSFAGALGVPQFMPGSYRAYAVDFDGDGRVDLWTSPADIVGSVGNFLARHDWAPGQPALLPAVIADDARDAALRRLDGGISERRALDAWASDGVTAVDAPNDLAPEPVGLLMLEEGVAANDDPASYWIACHNFYVLTRYNRSRLYAAAVWKLAQAIKAERDGAAH